MLTLSKDFFSQVLDRGEKIELLVDKTDNLRSQVCACNFKHIYIIAILNINSLLMFSWVHV